MMNDELAELAPVASGLVSLIHHSSLLWGAMIENFLKEYQTYRRLGLKAIAQVSDDALNKVLGADNNSIAVVVRHISGNLRSRFTDFLTSDGEKPWRDRDSEFQPRSNVTRGELLETWNAGWKTLFGAL